MKFVTKIEKKPDKKQKSNLIAVVVLLIDLVFNPILPFVVGFYFAYTTNMLYLLAFFFLIAFQFKIDYHDDKITIKIIRGL